MEVLGQMLTPGLREWELVDTAPRMAVERQILKDNHAAYALELLHAAAYRCVGRPQCARICSSGSLGHSLVSPKYMIGAHNSVMMRKFMGASRTTRAARGCRRAHGRVGGVHRGRERRP